MPSGMDHEVWSRTEAPRRAPWHRPDRSRRDLGPRAPSPISMIREAHGRTDRHGRPRTLKVSQWKESGQKRAVIRGESRPERVISGSARGCEERVLVPASAANGRDRPGNFMWNAKRLRATLHLLEIVSVYQRLGNKPARAHRRNLGVHSHAAHVPFTSIVEFEYRRLSHGIRPGCTEPVCHSVYASHIVAISYPKGNTSVHSIPNGMPGTQAGTLPPALGRIRHAHKAARREHTRRAASSPPYMPRGSCFAIS